MCFYGLQLTRWDCELFLFVYRLHQSKYAASHHQSEEGSSPRLIYNGRSIKPSIAIKLLEPLVSSNNRPSTKSIELLRLIVMCRQAAEVDWGERGAVHIIGERTRNRYTWERVLWNIEIVWAEQAKYWIWSRSEEHETKSSCTHDKFSLPPFLWYQMASEWWGNSHLQYKWEFDRKWGNFPKYFLPKIISKVVEGNIQAITLIYIECLPCGATSENIINHLSSSGIDNASIPWPRCVWPEARIQRDSIPHVRLILKQTWARLAVPPR